MNRKNRDKRYYNKHKKKISLSRRKYYLKNKEIILKKRKIYGLTHTKEISDRKKRNYNIHRSELIKQIVENERKRLKTDIQFKLSKNLRTRLRLALKDNQKNGSAVRELGCSIAYLKQYIESKFYNGMTWNNWGKVWELDHIKELYTFDLTDKEQFLEAVHFTNLQPLTVEDHRYKSNADIKVK